MGVGAVMGAVLRETKAEREARKKPQIITRENGIDRLAMEHGVEY